MAKKTWNITLDGKNHEIALNHGYWSGKRQVFVDGHEVKLPISTSQMLLDFGNTLPFEVGGKHYEIQIKTNGLTFSYDLQEQGQTETPSSRVEMAINSLYGEIVTSEQAAKIIKETATSIVGLAVFAFIVAFFRFNELRILDVVLFSFLATWLYKRPSTVPILALVVLTIVSMVASSITGGSALIHVLVFWLLFRSYQAIRFPNRSKSGE